MGVLRNLTLTMHPDDQVVVEVEDIMFMCAYLNSAATFGVRKGGERPESSTARRAKLVHTYSSKKGVLFFSTVRLCCLVLLCSVGKVAQIAVL
jgi:hypothetical protein